MKEPTFNIKRDLKRVAVVLAVIIIPLMYSYFYLNAFWDPYSKLDKLPVAVVNEDKGAVINSEQRNIGRELVDELKENNKLKWVFTDKSGASEGLKDRKYYASINIPENFSSNIASADSIDKKQAVIIYQPEQKRNFLASQILSKVVMELEAKVTEKTAKEMVGYLVDETKKQPDKLNELCDGLDKMHTDGTTKLKDNIEILVDNQQKFNDGVDKLNNYLNKAAKGAEALNKGSGTLAMKLGEFHQGLSGSISQFKQLADGSSLFLKNLTALDSGMVKLNDGASLMNSRIPELKAGITKYSDSLKAFSKGIAPLATGLEPLKTGSAQVYNGMNDYSAQMDKFSTGISQYVGSVKTLSDTDKNIAAMLAGYVKQHPEVLKDDTIKSIVAILQKSQSSLEQLDSTSDSIKASTGALAAASQKLTAGSKQVNDGIVKFADGAKPLSEGAAELSAGAGTLITGLDTVSNGTSQMLEAVSRATGGAEKLKEVYESIDAGIQKASGSIEQAATGAGALSEATKKLGLGASELKSGINEIGDGGKLLKDNAEKLLEGERKLCDGASELDDKVIEAYQKVADSKAEIDEKLPKLNGLADFAADPVRIDEKDVDAVSDYGTAFAPYFMSLSLWVGALIMFIVIYLNPQIRFKKKLIKNAHMDIKYLVYPLIGIVQAIALGLILLDVLKLKVNDVPMFFTVIILVSLCFVSIVQFLIVNLGDVGKFLAMLLLILQLTASAGTFPNELVPRFFNVINPFMPMTYSIYALKETISGRNYTFLYQNMLVLAAIMVVFLLVSLFLSGNKSGKSVESSGLELYQG